MSKDTAFQMGASNLRFGVGTTREIGMDLSDMGLERVLVITDPNLVDLPPVQNREREPGIRRHRIRSVRPRARGNPQMPLSKTPLQSPQKARMKAMSPIGGRFIY